MKKKHCYAILCIIWMLVIFWFSAQVADDSQEMSDFFVHLLDAVFSLDIMRNEIIRDMTSFLVRKAAHMSEYAVLAILFGLTIREYKKEPWLLLCLWHGRLRLPMRQRMNFISCLSLAEADSSRMF